MPGHLKVHANKKNLIYLDKKGPRWMWGSQMNRNTNDSRDVEI